MRLDVTIRKEIAMKNNLFYTTACVAGMSAVAAYAATGQGSTGDTSTGTVDVKMEVLEEVKVSNLDDIDLGTYVPDGTDEVAEDQFCIYYNNASTVNVTLSSANANAGFNLEETGAGTATIPYTVAVQITPSTSGAYGSHTEGATVKYDTAYTGADNDCNGGGAGLDAAAISVTVNDTGAGTLGVPTGSYLDTITIKVEPAP